MVHLLRGALRFASYKDRTAPTAALKPVYTAATEDDALTALDTFADPSLEKMYPPAMTQFDAARDLYTPYVAFPPALRRVIYTTNSIESPNFQLRK